MLEIKRKTPLLALIGALALVTAAPALAQAPADPAAATADAAAAPAADAAAAPVAEAAPEAPAEAAAPAPEAAGKLTVVGMFLSATLIVKVVMIALLISSGFSWTLLITKIMEFGRLNRETDTFLEQFRTAKTIADVGRMASVEEYQGNPLADMASAAAMEVKLSSDAGLKVGGEHRESTIARVQAAIGAVQASLVKRLSNGMQFLASIGSSGPFIGLFGTVYGIMNSFIGIANTNTTNLAVVAPGIAEALLATGIGLFAAIPSVIFYNYFQTRISSYGVRSEGFVAELMNFLSRQLDKGA
jgi:biopolymer transport protein ExbB